MEIFINPRKLDENGKFGRPVINSSLKGSGVKDSI